MGVKLTIPEGVTLQFNGVNSAQQLRVEGELEVLGTALAPVVFESGRDTPARDHWQGIVITPSATSGVPFSACIRASLRLQANRQQGPAAVTHFELSPRN